MLNTVDVNLFAFVNEGIAKGESEPTLHALGVVESKILCSVREYVRIKNGICRVYSSLFECI